MKIEERFLAITDIETTGIIKGHHEIIEIGLVVVDQKTLQIQHLLEYKVKPRYPERITQKAQEINGYNADDWKDACSLESVLGLYAELTENAMFVAWNNTFDWGFMERAFEESKVANKMDYHRIDLFTMAWAELRYAGLEKCTQDEVATRLGLHEEPKPHRALAGAMISFEIFKRLSARSKVGTVGKLHDEPLWGDNMNP